MSDEPEGVSGAEQPVSEEPAGVDEPVVIYTADPPTAIITLNRPARRNALNDDLVTGLHTALDLALDDDQIRAVILTGAGNAFCSGVDLDEADGQTDGSFEERLADADRLARLFRRLRSFEKVTIAAVNGPALASGCGLATLCDFTLATGQARFGYSEVRYGYVPAIVLVYMRGLLNEKRLRDLVLTGRLLSADEACEIGLVSEVVPADDLLERGREIATQIARNAPRSIQMTKELLETLPGLEIERALKAAVEYSARMSETDECKEGVRAFLEKREPDWSCLERSDPGEAIQEPTGDGPVETESDPAPETT